MDSIIQLENFPQNRALCRAVLAGNCCNSPSRPVYGCHRFCLALILALMRMSNLTPFRALGLDADGLPVKRDFCSFKPFQSLGFIATAYVEILRSTPVLVQIFIIYYGVFSIIDIPKFQLFGFIRFDRFIPVLSLGMNSGAYLCEIIRSGIQSIDIGQTEAAASRSVSEANLRYIILPQAIKNILPAIAMNSL